MRYAPWRRRRAAQCHVHLWSIGARRGRCCCTLTRRAGHVTDITEKVFVALKTKKSVRGNALQRRSIRLPWAVQVSLNPRGSWTRGTRWLLPLLGVVCACVCSRFVRARAPGLGAISWVGSLTLLRRRVFVAQHNFEMARRTGMLVAVLCVAAVALATAAAPTGARGAARARAHRDLSSGLFKRLPCTRARARRACRPHARAMQCQGPLRPLLSRPSPGTRSRSRLRHPSRTGAAP